VVTSLQTITARHLPQKAKSQEKGLAARQTIRLAARQTIRLTVRLAARQTVRLTSGRPSG
jgi:hypothetical protein